MKYIFTYKIIFLFSLIRFKIIYIFLNLQVECNPEISRRLKDMETALLSIQDTKQKTEDDLSEIK